MSRKALLLSVLALFLGFEVGYAQGEGTGLEPDPEAGNTRVGTRGANFLEIGIGARGMALAGAGATLQPGVFSMYWNPGAMASVEGFGVGFSYAALYADLGIDYFYGAAMLPFIGGVLGVNWAGLSSGDIERTTEAYPDGNDPIFGPTFDWRSSFVGAYYARAITDRLNIGGGIKFITEGITEASAKYVAFDAGVTFRTGLYGIELGATAQNIGSEGEFRGSAVKRILDSGDQIFAPLNRDLEIDLDTRSHELPTLFRFTVNLDVIGTPESLLQGPGEMHSLDVSVDLLDAVDTELQTAIGLEYSFRQIGFLRVGKRFYNEAQRTGDIRADVGGAVEYYRTDDFRDFWHGVSFGGGVRIPAMGRNLAFDYAYVDMGELENIQVFSFEYGL